MTIQFPDFKWATYRTESSMSKKEEERHGVKRETGKKDLLCNTGECKSAHRATHVHFYACFVYNVL